MIITIMVFLLANTVHVSSLSKCVFVQNNDSFICPIFIHCTKMLGIITFSIMFSDKLHLTVCCNTSAYVAIIWLSFDKKLTVLSKSQTELRSVKYGNAPQNEVYRSMEDDRH